MIIYGNYHCRHSIILNPAKMKELDSFLHKRYNIVLYEAVLKDKSSIDFLDVDEMLDFCNFRENRIVNLSIHSRNEDYTEKQDIKFEPEYGFFRLLTTSAKIIYKTEKAENKAIINSFYDDFFNRSRSTYWYVLVLSVHGILNFLWGLFIIIGLISGFLSFPPNFSKPFTGGDFFFAVTFGIIFSITPILINKVIIALLPPIVFEWGEERSKEKNRQKRKSNVVWLIISTIVAFISPWLFGRLFK